MKSNRGVNNRFPEVSANVLFKNLHAHDVGRVGHEVVSASFGLRLGEQYDNW